MKRLLIILIFITASAGIISETYAAAVPKNESIINDYAGVMTKVQRQKAIGFARGLQKKTGAEVAALTMKSLEGEQIDDFAVRVFNTWKLGERNKDNGVLLIVSIEDRQMRIEVGYGLEEVLTDGICGEILDQMIPFMRNEWYGQAIYNGILRIINQIAVHNDVSISEFPQVDHIKEPKKTSALSAIAHFIGQLIGLLILMGLMGTRMGLFTYFMLGGTGRGYWSGGNRGGFGSSSGFGGFGGGGMSGGGGASRSW
ncbi:TPM domain-containing protein [bacterium]|nr:TPM domain-containing protein [bacterium]